MLKKILIHGFQLNLDCTVELVRDIPGEEMALCPPGFTNHGVGA